MARSRLRRWIPYLCTAIAVQLVYLATLAPSLTWAHWGGDGGDFITAAVTGRVSHPPGSPAYHLVSRAWVLVLSGDPARALNLLSAVMATGSVLFVVAALRQRGHAWLIVGPVALTLAFAPWLWSQAILTEVYTTGAFIASIAIYLGETRFATRWAGSLLIGLVWGVAVSVHLSLGLLGIYVLLCGKQHWSAVGLGLLLGLLPYVLLPAFGPWPQPWGDLRSLEGWWDFVSGRVYWGNAFALPASSWPRRTLAWVVMVSRQFTPPGLLLVLVGTVQLWRRQRRKTLGVVMAWTAASLYAIGYNSADSWVYLVAFLPLLALALAEGLHWIVEQGMPAWAGLVLPLLLLVLNWTALDLHTDREATVWLEQTLERLPCNALVLTSGDRQTFALWYATDALGLREDLLVVDQRLWGYAPYVEYLGARAGLVNPELDSLTRGRTVCDIAENGEVVCQ